MKQSQPSRSVGSPAQRLNLTTPSVLHQTDQQSPSTSLLPAQRPNPATPLSADDEEPCVGRVIAMVHFVSQETRVRRRALLAAAFPPPPAGTDLRKPSGARGGWRHPRGRSNYAAGIDPVWIIQSGKSVS
ncbi:hypothetical protein Fcan01_26754 [Folsomia candida]|uniref:Uncharacterized protein n=1 Tax=Folsomia candida TaxID=158441 RepID=A0A226CZ29_FOLCA|nr:hypothetical protein Fcan01_26754 [Folsomia candida]